MNKFEFIAKGIIIPEKSDWEIALELNKIIDDDLESASLSTLQIGLKEFRALELRHRILIPSYVL